MTQTGSHKGSRASTGAGQGALAGKGGSSQTARVKSPVSGGTGTQAGRAVAAGRRSGSLASSVARVTGKTSGGRGLGSSSAGTPPKIKGGQGRLTPRAIAPAAGKAGGAIVKKASDSLAMKADKVKDKKDGIKEGSPRDKKIDAAVMRRGQK